MIEENATAGYSKGGTTAGLVNMSDGDHAGIFAERLRPEMETMWPLKT
jgi:hypothetical protein